MESQELPEVYDIFLRLSGHTVINKLLFSNTFEITIYNLPSSTTSIQLVSGTN
jgi:hypothetical protein